MCPPQVSDPSQIPPEEEEEEPKPPEAIMLSENIMADIRKFKVT